MMMITMTIIIISKLVHLGLLEFLYIATIVASSLAAPFQAIITNT